jgi:hypothetical protein
LGARLLAALHTHANTALTHTQPQQSTTTNSQHNTTTNAPHAHAAIPYTIHYGLIFHLGDWQFDKVCWRFG